MGRKKKIDDNQTTFSLNFNFTDDDFKKPKDILINIVNEKFNEMLGLIVDQYEQKNKLTGEVNERDRRSK
jgi:hypothetical protein